MNLLLKHSYFAESSYVQFSRTKQKSKNELIYRLEKRMVQSRFSTDPRVHIHIQQSKQQVMGHMELLLLRLFISVLYKWKYVYWLRGGIRKNFFS